MCILLLFILANDNILCFVFILKNINNGTTILHSHSLSFITMWRPFIIRQSSGHGLLVTVVVNQASSMLLLPISFYCSTGAIPLSIFSLSLSFSSSSILKKVFYYWKHSKTALNPKKKKTFFITFSFLFISYWGTKRKKRLN